MKLITTTKKIINSFFNIPNIPEELKGIQEPFVLHISDTPASYHPFIYRLIQELKPDFFIHTGDLVDNIKLEYNPQLYDYYKRDATAFIQNLERLLKGKVFFVPGNHDILSIIKQSCKDSMIIKEGNNLILENIIINVAHHPWNLDLNTDAYYFLYGHNTEIIPSTNQQIYLNGLNKIHVILLHSHQVIPIQYPYGINQDRRMYARATLYK